MANRRGDLARTPITEGAGMKQQETFAIAGGAVLDGGTYAAFLLGRAVAILEGLVESPTDAIDMELARDLLDDYRKWMTQES